MTRTRIRRARPEEAGLLSELAFRSKAHWGYDDAFMAACRDDLTLMPRALAERPHYLLEYKDHIAGFYNLAKTPDGVFLQNLFVAPELIGRGVGGRLWAHMVRGSRS
jgi:GNAT superfamily N-acetyltransferase